jgi:hypothetical protein
MYKNIILKMTNDGFAMDIRQIDMGGFIEVGLSRGYSFTQ